MSVFFDTLAQKFVSHTANVRDFETAIFFLHTVMKNDNITTLDETSLMLQRLNVTRQLLATILSFYYPTFETASPQYALLVLCNRDPVAQNWLPTKKEIDDVCSLFFMKSGTNRKFYALLILYAALEDTTKNEFKGALHMKLLMPRHREMWQSMKSDSRCACINKILETVLAFGWIPLLDCFDDSEELLSMSAIAMQCNFLSKMDHLVRSAVPIGLNFVLQTLQNNWRIYLLANFKDAQLMRLSIGASRLIKSVVNCSNVDISFVTEFEHNRSVDSIVKVLFDKQECSRYYASLIRAIGIARLNLNELLSSLVDLSADELCSMNMRRKAACSHGQRRLIWLFLSNPVPKRVISEIQEAARAFSFSVKKKQRRMISDDDDDGDEFLPLDNKRHKVSDTTQTYLSVAAIDALSVQQSMDLSCSGYCILRNAFVSNPSLIAALTRAITTNRSTSSVFNRGRDFDGYRLQVPLNMVNDQIVSEFNIAITCLLSRLFSLHDVHDGVILYSRPGCPVQDAHADYDKTLELAMAPDILRPLGALVAVQDHTKIFVWPGSQKLSLINPAYWKKVPAINRQTLMLNAGEILVFDGTLIHAGADYESANVRAHFYLDTNFVPREDNNTMLVKEDMHGNHTMPVAFKNIIKE